ncbi:unknown [Clostridium sp. CAG:1013]|nr:unknown [Clostridium sp. CAG:1013]
MSVSQDLHVPHFSGRQLQQNLLPVGDFHQPLALLHQGIFLSEVRFGLLHGEEAQLASVVECDLHGDGQAAAAHCIGIFRLTPRSHPPYHNPPALVVHKGLRRVEVGAQNGALEFLGSKVFPVELTQHILHRLGLIHPGEAQHPLVPQGEQVGAFQDGTHFPGLKQLAHILPVEQIRRLVQHHGGETIQAHAADHTVSAVGPGEHLGVPEINAVGVHRALGNDGILRMLYKVDSILGGGQALGLGFVLSHRGVEQIEGAVLFHSRAGEASQSALVGLVGIESDGKFLPVDQIVADSVAPVHGVPHRRVRVMLEKGVVFALKITETVGVVKPTLVGLHMVLQLRKHGKTLLYLER